MNEYNIGVDEVSNVPSVYICLNHQGNYLSSFLTIEVDDKDAPSPFKSVKEARIFAEILVKLMRIVE